VLHAIMRRLAIAVMRTGSAMNAFQARQQASTMAS